MKFKTRDERHTKTLRKAGSYLVWATEVWRGTTNKGDANIHVRLAVVDGPCTGETHIARFNLTGNGTGYTADFFEAVGVTEIEDVYNDLDVSKAIGRKVLAAKIGIRKWQGETQLNLEQVRSATAQELERVAALKQGVKASIFIDPPPERPKRDANNRRRDDRSDEEWMPPE